MKRRIFLLVAIFFCSGILASANPAATDKPKAKRPVAQAKKPLPPPAPFVPGSWTLAVLPDTQYYARQFPGLLQLQTRWIAENKTALNIAYVLQEGDLTNDNSPKQWDRVDRAFRLLDSVVPYAIVPGNHDYVRHGAKGRAATLINDYFPPSRFQKTSTFGGTMEPGHIENNYHLFEAGGKQWLIIGLEWAPRDAALQWAGQILEKYPDRKAVVVTHAYLLPDSTRCRPVVNGKQHASSVKKYNILGSSNDGEEIWQKLIKKHANVVLVVNGHFLGDGLGFQVSRADDGHRVNEMFVNYQMKQHGGEAWLRLLEFLPDGKTVQAKTYSPLFESYQTDSQNQFTFEIDE